MKEPKDKGQRTKETPRPKSQGPTGRTGRAGGDSVASDLNRSNSQRAIVHSAAPTLAIGAWKFLGPLTLVLGPFPPVLGPLHSLHHS
jgi:hypothetical protein